MFDLKRNLPTWERAVRLLLAASVAASATLLATGWAAWAGWAAAAMLAVTALAGFCPACAMVGRRPFGR